MSDKNAVVCAKCDASCYGDTVIANSKPYHATCFTCAVEGCLKDITTDGYFVVDDVFYCRDDYHNFQNTIRCTACKECIDGDAVNVNESVYHPSCFACVKCRKVFPQFEEIFLDGDQLFCVRC